MLVCPSAYEVREIVERTFRSLGLDESEITDLSENLMIDEGRCRARTYRTECHMAMWMIDIGLLQFYDEDGNMLHHANLLAHAAPRRMAA